MGKDKIFVGIIVGSIVLVAAIVRWAIAHGDDDRDACLAGGQVWSCRHDGTTVTCQMVGNVMTCIPHPKEVCECTPRKP